MYNSLKILIRNLYRNALYTWINIVGLAVSLTAAILILLWVQDELSYDRFHHKSANIYRINASIAGGPFYSESPAPIAIHASTENPEIEAACRVQEYRKIYLEHDGLKFYDLEGIAVDTSFFSMFTFFPEGANHNPFTDDFSLVITESKAKVIFGEENPVGKTLKSDDGMQFHIVAVVKDPPKNSSITFDFLVPFYVLNHTYDGGGYWQSIDQDWGNFSGETYLLLRSESDIERVGSNITNLFVQRINALFECMSAG